MAILNNNQDDELDATGNPVAKQNPTGGQSGFVGGGTGQGATTTNGSAPTSSGSYTNLQDYLTGNQAGEQKMADNLTQNVNNLGTTAQNSLGTYQTDATNDAKAGTANVDQGKVNEINSGAAKATWNANNVLNASAPGGYSGPQSVTAQYGGPQDINHLSGASADAQTKAYQDVGKAKDTVGQVTGGFDKLGAYLKGQNQAGKLGDTGYTAGENNLDTFVTGASAPGQQAISGAKSQWGNIGDQATAADNAVSGAIQSGKDTSAATQNTYSNAISNAKAQSDKVAKQYQADRQSAQQAAALQAAQNSPFAAPLASGATNIGLAVPGPAAPKQAAAPAAPTYSHGPQAVDENGNPRFDESGNPIYQGEAQASYAAEGGKVPGFSGLMSKLRSK